MHIPRLPAGAVDEMFSYVSDLLCAGRPASERCFHVRAVKPAALVPKVFLHSPTYAWSPS